MTVRPYAFQPNLIQCLTSTCRWYGRWRMHGASASNSASIVIPSEVPMLARTRKTAFTLVEILIVVIILGLLAAIVIPQFTNASQDARESALASQLQTLRSQIELYKLQHGDVLPDLVTDWTPLTTASIGADGNSVGPY